MILGEIIKLKIIIGIIFLLSILNPFKIFYERNIPTTSEQEQIIAEEVVKLDLHEFKEAKRYFLRYQTYIVSYEFINSLLHKDEIENILIKKFRNSGWCYKHERPLIDGVLEIVFIKNEHECIVRIYNNSIDLNFSYKSEAGKIKGNNEYKQRLDDKN